MNYLQYSKSWTWVGWRPARFLICFRGHMAQVDSPARIKPQQSQRKMTKTWTCIMSWIKNRGVLYLCLTQRLSKDKTGVLIASEMSCRMITEKRKTTSLWWSVLGSLCRVAWFKSRLLGRQEVCYRVKLQVEWVQKRDTISLIVCWFYFLQNTKNRMSTLNKFPL